MLDLVDALRNGSASIQRAGDIEEDHQTWKSNKASLVRRMRRPCDEPGAVDDIRTPRLSLVWTARTIAVLALVTMMVTRINFTVVQAYCAKSNTTRSLDKA